MIECLFVLGLVRSGLPPVAGDGSGEPHDARSFGAAPEVPGVMAFRSALCRKQR
jgi:hypothetical protein